MQVFKLTHGLRNPSSQSGVCPPYPKRRGVVGGPTKLLGLAWAGTNRSLRETRTGELKALQHSDGGWGQTPYLVSDAYATAQVLYALHELGQPASDPAIQRGIAFLLRTQAEDGTWHVTSRGHEDSTVFRKWISIRARPVDFTVRNRLGRNGTCRHRSSSDCGSAQRVLRKAISERWHGTLNPSSGRKFQCGNRPSWTGGVAAP